MKESLRPPKALSFFMQGCLKPVGFRTSAYLPPEAPFLSATKEMGEERRQKPMVFGFPSNLRGPKGHTNTCRCWRQVRDLIIAQNGSAMYSCILHLQRQRG